MIQRVSIWVFRVHQLIGVAHLGVSTATSHLWAHHRCKSGASLFLYPILASPFGNDGATALRGHRGAYPFCCVVSFGPSFRGLHIPFPLHLGSVLYDDLHDRLSYLTRKGGPVCMPRSCLISPKFVTFFISVCDSFPSLEEPSLRYLEFVEARPADCNVSFVYDHTLPVPHILPE